MPASNTDPIWSLIPWPVEVDLVTGDTIEIRAEPALTWLQYLLSEQPDFIGLLEDLMPELDDAFFQHELPISALYKQLFEIIGIVSGRPYWVAMRLIQIAATAWNIIGPRVMTSGVDVTKVSLAGWLDAVLFLIVTNMDPKDTNRFCMQLEAPPPDNLFDEDAEPKDHMDSMVMDRSAFMAMAR